MTVRMVTLTQSKNGDYVPRKGIPADVRDAYTRLYRDSAKAPLGITRKGGQPTAPKVGRNSSGGPHRHPQVLQGCLGAMERRD